MTDWLPLFLDPRFWYGVALGWWALYGIYAVVWILSVLCASAFIFIGVKYLSDARQK